MQCSRQSKNDEDDIAAHMGKGDSTTSSAWPLQLKHFHASAFSIIPESTVDPPLSRAVLF